AAAAVDAHDLLLDGVGAAGENAALHRRGVTGVAPDPRRVGATLPEERYEMLARLVPADPPDDEGPAVERRDVVRRVGAAAGEPVGPAVGENEDRGLPGDAVDLAVLELVEHKVGDDENADPAHPVDHLEQLIARRRLRLHDRLRDRMKRTASRR